MKKKYVLEKNKYNGNRTKNLRKAMIYFVLVVVSGVTLFLEGCFFEKKASAIENEETFTPYSTATIQVQETPVSTTKPTPSPISTVAPIATPEPTATPEPLTIEEKIEMMEVYDGKDKDSIIPFNSIGFIDYEIDGMTKIMIVGIGISTDPEDGIEKVYLWNVVDCKDIIYYNSNIIENRGPNGVDYFTGALPYTDGYKGKKLEMKHIGSVSELESYLKSKGVDVPETKYSPKINNPDATGGMSSPQFAEYLATILPENLYAFPSELFSEGAYSTPVPTK